MSTKEIQKVKDKNIISQTFKKQKIYINFHCFKISLNILYTLVYIIAAIFLNLINRIIFYTYHFNKYNFTFMLFQQIFCIIFFYIVSHKSNIFKTKAGVISFQDFTALKYYYISFSFLFILNTLLIFIGTQMIVNASMFQTLRKLSLVIIYFIDLFFGKSKITVFTTICVFIVTFGSILSGIDNFSKDYIGIALTMVSNCVNVAYNKFTELFKKKANVSNLKLLIYSNYLSGPILILLIFITREYKDLFKYFVEKKYDEELKNDSSLLGFIIINLITCFLVILLNSTFFMSNENNNSMFTNVMANTKDIFLCILSYLLLDGNKLTINIILGLIISTIGAVMFSFKSIYDNISTTRKKRKAKKSKNDTNMNNSTLQIIEVKNDLSFSLNQSLYNNYKLKVSEKKL